MDQFEQYIEHNAGIYSLLSWLNAQSDNGLPYTIDKQIIYLNPIISRHFSFGVSKNKSKKIEPFFGIQSIESEWFNLIKWKDCYLIENDKYLYFTTHMVPGDQENYPDIASFVLALYIDTKEKINLIKNLKNLIGREYFFDGKSINVNFHKKVFSLPLSLKNEDYIHTPDTHLITDLSKIISRKESLMEGYSEKPEFAGELAKIEGTDSLLKKWKKNEI